MATLNLGAGAPYANGAEKWREVPGAPGYEVSDAGRVRSWRPVGRPGRDPNARTSTPRYLTGGTQRYGHVCYSLRVDGRSLWRFGHALVMEAFVGPCPDGHEIAHADGDATNNRLENLRYATRAQNQADRRFHETEGYGVVRHGEPVFLSVRERRGLAALRDSIAGHDPDGAALLANVLSRVGEAYGRRRLSKPGR